jgi:hypothetical protein
MRQGIFPSFPEDSQPQVRGQVKVMVGIVIVAQFREFLKPFTKQRYLVRM